MPAGVSRSLLPRFAPFFSRARGFGPARGRELRLLALLVYPRGARKVATSRNIHGTDERRVISYLGSHLHPGSHLWILQLDAAFSRRRLVRRGCELTLPLCELTLPLCELTLHGQLPLQLRTPRPQSCRVFRRLRGLTLPTPVAPRCRRRVAIVAQLCNKTQYKSLAELMYPRSLPA
jgi:hypothetical protein